MHLHVRAKTEIQYKKVMLFQSSVVLFRSSCFFLQLDLSMEWPSALHPFSPMMPKQWSPNRSLRGLSPSWKMG